MRVHAPVRKRSAFIVCITLFAFLATTTTRAAQTITFFHNDGAGTPILATDSNGSVVWKETYRPYGDRLVDASTSDNNKLWFTGKPFDEETGLSYFGARYYDPTIGRFLGIDPAAPDLSNLHRFNRYGYANNNPYKFVDPDGRLPIIIPIIFGLAALMAADAANAPVPGEVPQPRGDAARAGLSALVPGPSGALLSRQVMSREVTEEVATKSGGQALLAAPKMVKHHIFNVFRGNSPGSQVYRDFFKKHGIDLDKHTVEVSEVVHRQLHAAGNNWTTKWKSWIDANPKATTKEVYQQAGHMMDEYGIGHLPIGPY